MANRSELPEFAPIRDFVKTFPIEVVIYNTNGDEIRHEEITRWLCVHAVPQKYLEFFLQFFDERLAEEDLGEILDEEEIKRIKTAPQTIPPMLQF